MSKSLHISSTSLANNHELCIQLGKSEGINWCPSNGHQKKRKRKYPQMHNFSYTETDAMALKKLVLSTFKIGKNKHLIAALHIYVTSPVI